MDASLSDRTGLPLPAFAPPTFDPWRPADPDRGMAVMMSGGVDSSATALLLKRAGWDVCGITMRIPVADRCSNARPCCGWEAAWVCRELGIPHYFLETTDHFQRGVIDAFRAAYRAGRTPNPCVDCNTALKFGVTMDAVAATFGVRRAATGHYARIVQGPDGWALGRAADARRDQSYFLYGIPRDRLERLSFPLGDWSKEDVRALAREAGLTTAEKTASMDLCFAGEGDYRTALDASPLPGPIVAEDGRVLGRHPGIAGFTPGQRKGLEIAAAEPLYVLRLDVPANTVVVGPRARAMVSAIEAAAVNVLQPARLRPGARLFGRIRSTGEPTPCAVVDAEGARLRVEFDPPVFAPAAGQHLVLYDAEGRVVAGGTIAGSPLEAARC